MRITAQAPLPRGARAVRSLRPDADLNTDTAFGAMMDAAFMSAIINACACVLRVSVRERLRRVFANAWRSWRNATLTLDGIAAARAE